MAIKSRAARSKRTKDELIDELETLERKVSSQEAPDPTAQAIAKENITKVREAVKGLSVDTIVANGAKFGLEVQRTVAGLTEQAVQKAEELRKLEEAIEIETAELEKLYDLDVAAASVKALIEEHQLKKETLEKEIAHTRTIWTEEQLAHTKTVNQRNADVEALRRREQADYDYRTKQERQRSEEEFQYKLQIAERDQAEKAAQAQKQIDSRVAEITKQEAELAAGKARIEGLDAELEKKTASAVAIATNSLKKDLLNGFEMEKKDLQLQIRLEQQKSEALASTNERLSQEIDKLQKQLDASRQEVRDIAKSAVEGASGQLALSKVMEVRSENGASPKKS